MQLEPGMLARSKAGHDKNCIYVIICVKDEYVYLADGSFVRSAGKEEKPEACAADQKGLQYLGDR